jgi:hypothetical protein
MLDRRAWHEVDWRFMLPDPRLGPVWLAPECAGEDTTLRAIGVDVVSGLGGGAEAAFVDGSQCDFPSLEQALSPGALVRIAVVHGRGWGISDKLEARGWQLLGRVWAAGGIRAALGYVDLDNRRAVMHWWRILQPRGLHARVTVAVRLTLVRVGLWRLLCREGFVFARTPV